MENILIMNKIDVIILAGGLGTRLRSVVSELPKCMAPVCGKPFLSYLLDYLKQYEINKVILSVGYLRDSIIQFIDNHKDSKTAKKYGNAYNRFFATVFCESYQDYIYKTTGLFGNLDTKQWLEDYFKIDLTI